MQSLRARLGALVAVLACAAGATPTAAATNGNLPSSTLARVHHPTLKLFLEREAAAAFNTLELRIHARTGKAIYPGGPDSAYRTHARQVYWRAWWCVRGRCGNAAVPGTSNHGLGLAVDLATPAMRQLVDRYGAPLGWAKRWSDAAHEWWHLRYRTGVWTPRPDPGPSVTFPLLVEGSGGLGQSYYVRIVQRRLRLHLGDRRLHVDGELGRSTRLAVRRFQRVRSLPVDGRVGERTWRALKRGVVAPQTETTLPKPTPAPVVPAPVPVVVNGPDISSYQPDVDFRAVRAAGYEFVVFKSSEGQDYRDRAFTKARMDAARAAGLVRGVYHFLRPRAGRTGAVEARFAVATAKAAGWGRGDLPIAADLETTTLSPAATLAYLHSFVAEVRRLTGRRALVYTGPGFWHSIGNPMKTYGTPLWVAHYGPRQPTIPSAWRGKYSLWQFTDKAQVPGIRGGVDMSVIPGGLAELDRLRGADPVPVR